VSDSDRPRDLRAVPPGERRLEVRQRPAVDVTRAEAIPLSAADIEQAPHFWDYWRVVMRRRWIVLTCFLTSIMVAAVVTITTQPVYRGTVTLKIEKDQPRVLKFDEVIQETNAQLDYYQTQYKMLRTRILASRVIKELSLDQHPEFQGVDDERGWVGRGIAAVPELARRLIPAVAQSFWTPSAELEAESAESDRSFKHALVVDAYLNRLSVAPVRNSRLVTLSFDSRDPGMAARVANKAAEAFIAHQLDQKVEATRYARDFLAQQLDHARAKLGEAESRLNRFLEQHDILFVSGDKAGQPQDLVTQQLVALSDALLKARSDRIMKETAIAQLATQDSRSLPAVLRSPLVSELKQQLGTLEAEYKRLGQTFKAEYPRMQQLTEKIQETRSQLETEIGRTVDGLRAEYQAAVQGERELETALISHQTRARGLNARMAEYNLLRRDVDTNRELYGSLLSRLRETQISASLLTSNISIADRAEVPRSRVRPRRMLNLLVGVVIGLVGGIGLAFLIDYLDTTIKTAREAERLLRVQMLGEIPFRALRGREARQARRLSAGHGRQSFALVSHVQAASPFAEVFRNLRTAILYSGEYDPPRSLMVTSVQPKEGKTSLATNLAVTLAELDIGAILLIDADLRRPKLHEVLNIAKTPGLATALSGGTELMEVVKPTAIPNLFAIPSGTSRLNPAEIWASARLREALGTLGHTFRYIVLDTPPLIGVSDALLLASHVDGVVLTIREGRANRDAARRAISMLTSVRARLLGVVLNYVHGGSDYYGYDRYYRDYGSRYERSTLQPR
jgi:polysaccharide biosynthesis transport protein